ncbi:MAG: hypothetical protein AAGC54_14565 [Cyanobacteria bacterium P01_F01_bin.4]
MPERIQPSLIQPESIQYDNIADLYDTYVQTDFDIPFWMDVCELDLGQQFELIILPFHSFAELLSPAKQHSALTRIRSHLSPNGRFICTLHNPHVRLSTVDGKLRLWNRYPLKAGSGTLLFWGMETYDPGSEIVNGLEFFESYDSKGGLQSKRMIETRFRLISKSEFESLATSAGFDCLALYGNYDYSEFRAGASPYMIWMLG